MFVRNGQTVLPIGSGLPLRIMMGLVKIGWEMAMALSLCYGSDLWLI